MHLSRWLPFLCLLLSVFATPLRAQADADTSSRALVIEALTAEPARAQVILAELANRGATEVRPVLEAWRAGTIFSFQPTDDAPPRYVLAEPSANQHGTTQTFLRDIGTDALLLDAAGEPLAVDRGELQAMFPSRALRRALLQIVDLIALGSPQAEERKAAAIALGLKGEADYVTALEARRAIEKHAGVQDALDEGIALAQLALADRAGKLAAATRLAELDSLPALDRLRDLQRQALEAGDWSAEELGVLVTAIRDLEAYLKWVGFLGTAFFGLATGAVLLVVALGLAITFGLMGVINMSHGEMIALGAYSVFFVQELMIGWLGPVGREWYFIVSIPVAFVVSALAGLVLERSVIQFLYKRPLESLLATWGVSWILQQTFKLAFGAQNKNVESPTWLQGNLTFMDVSLGYNRLFIIGFAILILIGTWLLLTKTPLGLCIRAVMQNPKMAASMGISTSRTRMATFAFGSGLAGLAGAFLSQIGSVGSGLGQAYIVDSFMVVVAGGVGNLLGTLLTALGIGVVDNTLQPIMGPVMGRICVLFAIILFLQWKPGGLFPSRSRALD